ncbi:MAG: helix-turn-helix domain-containing protein [Burkholderiaceae bacterium]
MIGLRLKPGSIFNTTTLDSWLTSHDVTDLLTGDQIDEFCQVPASLTEALHCLASGERSINSVAKALAVSTRTLQREVGSRTGKSPHFWFALARVRRACRALPQFDRLADAAISFGFADQAHMSREMKRWLGVSPSAITSQSDIFEQLLQPGYG